MTIKEIHEQNEALYLKVDILEQKILDIYSWVKPIEKDEGSWKDCVAWLQEIEGGPKPTTRKSLGNMCGQDKLFQPGTHYHIKQNRRVFLRSKVEEAVRKSIAG